MILRTVGRALIVALALGAMSVCASPTIQQVRLSQMLIDPTKGNTVDIKFMVSEPGRAVVRLYDGRDWLVRELVAPQELAAGERSVRWDGRDQKGRSLPPEAYIFTITATSADGASATYDLTDQTSGAEVVVQGISVDRKTGAISYVLAEPARVRIRLGLDDHGPLLRTTIDWVPRTAGLQQEPWDGWDASKMLVIREHPRLVASVSALRLPDNTIFIGPPPQFFQLSPAVRKADGVRATNTHLKKRMFDTLERPIEERGDVTIQVTLPEAKERTAEGLPVVRDITPVRLDVPDALRERVLKYRFEPVFFVDGHFQFENEVGFLPMNWMWNPVGLNAGEHFLTVNLRGYEGDFGIATVKVRVEPLTTRGSR